MLRLERRLLSGGGLLRVIVAERRRGSMILVLVVGVDGEEGSKADILHCGQSIDLQSQPRTRLR
jgi:hypothetical protein